MKYQGLCYAALGLLLSSLLLESDSVWANPEGGQVVDGSADITVVNPNLTTITQSSAQAIINWQTFNINAGQTTQFIQPSSSSVALNRIFDANPSQILGNLTANGRIFLINPNGIIFGADSQVNVGSLIASTGNISDSNFMAGNYHFTQDANSTARIINEGTITAADSGLVGLVAPNVVNSGKIIAHLGKVALASGGTEYTVDLNGDNLIQFATGSAPTATTSVANHGKIIADGGTVVLSANTAGDIVENAVNMDGIVQAQSVSEKNGTITLSGGSSGNVNVSGTLDVTGQNAGETGGTVNITGHEVNLLKGTRINASGKAGGGKINVGGELHGGGTLQHAQLVYVDPDAVLNADATDNGNGGTIAVWSDQDTAAYGTFTARGGPNGGNGGTVETSGPYLDVNGIQDVDTSAPMGQAGTWLLDPAEITITDSITTGDCSITAGINPGDPSTLSCGDPDSPSIALPLIGSELNNNNVDIVVGVGPFPVGGTINYQAITQILSSGGKILTLQATGGTINVTGNILTDANLILDAAKIQIPGEISILPYGQSSALTAHTVSLNGTSSIALLASATDPAKGAIDLVAGPNPTTPTNTVNLSLNAPTIEFKSDGNNNAIIYANVNNVTKIELNATTLINGANITTSADNNGTTINLAAPSISNTTINASGNTTGNQKTIITLTGNGSGNIDNANITSSGNGNVEITLQDLAAGTSIKNTKILATGNPQSLFPPPPTPPSPFTTTINLLTSTLENDNIQAAITDNTYLPATINLTSGNDGNLNISGGHIYTASSATGAINLEANNITLSNGAVLETAAGFSQTADGAINFMKLNPSDTGDSVTFDGAQVCPSTGVSCLATIDTNFLNIMQGGLYYTGGAGHTQLDISADIINLDGMINTTGIPGNPFQGTLSPLVNVLSNNATITQGAQLTGQNGSLPGTLDVQGGTYSEAVIINPANPINLITSPSPISAFVTVANLNVTNQPVSLAGTWIVSPGGNFTFGTPVTLTGGTTLSGTVASGAPTTNITFNSPINGTFPLTLQNANTLSLSGANGGTIPLQSLTVNDISVLKLLTNTAITTSGDISFNNVLSANQGSAPFTNAVTFALTSTGGNININNSQLRTAGADPSPTSFGFTLTASNISLSNSVLQNHNGSLIITATGAAGLTESPCELSSLCVKNKTALQAWGNKLQLIANASSNANITLDNGTNLYTDTNGEALIKTNSGSLTIGSGGIQLLANTKGTITVPNTINLSGPIELIKGASLIGGNTSTVNVASEGQIQTTNSSGKIIIGGLDLVNTSGSGGTLSVASDDYSGEGLITIPSNITSLDLTTASSSDVVKIDGLSAPLPLSLSGTWESTTHGFNFSGPIVLTGTTTLDASASATATQTITLSGAISPFKQDSLTLNASGGININGNITTNGDQTYTTPAGVILTNNPHLTVNSDYVGDITFTKGTNIIGSGQTLTLIGDTITLQQVGANILGGSLNQINVTAETLNLNNAIFAATNSGAATVVNVLDPSASIELGGQFVASNGKLNVTGGLGIYNENVTFGDANKSFSLAAVGGAVSLNSLTAKAPLNNLSGTWIAKTGGFEFTGTIGNPDAVTINGLTVLQIDNPTSTTGTETITFNGDIAASPQTTNNALTLISPNSIIFDGTNIGDTNEPLGNFSSTPITATNGDMNVYANTIDIDGLSNPDGNVLLRGINRLSASNVQVGGAGTSFTLFLGGSKGGSAFGTVNGSTTDLQAAQRSKLDPTFSNRGNFYVNDCLITTGGVCITPFPPPPPQEPVMAVEQQYKKENDKKILVCTLDAIANDKGGGECESLIKNEIKDWDLL